MYIESANIVTQIPIAEIGLNGDVTTLLSTKADTNHTHDGMVIAGTVMKVMFVDKLPVQQEENVIYFVAKASE